LDEPWQHGAEWKNEGPEVTCGMIPFIWNIQNRQSHREKKADYQLLRDGGWGSREWLLECTECSSGGDGKSFETRDGGGCTTLYMF
jgi:hypothetical protein